MKHAGTHIRIEAEHFVAGLTIGGACAPIISYMRGWPLWRVLRYCDSKGWIVTVTDEPVPDDGSATPQ